MKMTLRWYGKKDKVSLKNISQIPNIIHGVITLLIDFPSMIRKLGGQEKNHFAYIRNIKRKSKKSFHETSHYSSDGSLDLYEMVKAYKDINFTGYTRPDQGRMIWDEEGMSGYGLSDRVLGICYINGLYEAI